MAPDRGPAATLLGDHRHSWLSGVMAEIVTSKRHAPRLARGGLVGLTVSGRQTAGGVPEERRDHEAPDGAQHMHGRGSTDTPGGEEGLQVVNVIRRVAPDEREDDDASAISVGVLNPVRGMFLVPCVRDSGMKEGQKRS